jgi:hypothetical protein
MALAERIAELEDEIDYLRAIVDGPEAHAREAIAGAVGLLGTYAARSGAFDLDGLIAFLTASYDPGLASDDRTGMLLHGIRLSLAHYRDLEAGASAVAESSVDSLTAGDQEAILRRAAALVAFDRDATHLG